MCEDVERITQTHDLRNSYYECKIYVSCKNPSFSMNKKYEINIKIW